MDQQTLSYYSKNAEKLFTEYNSIAGEIINRLGGVFKEKQRVLDIGAGSGRDVLELIKIGVRAVGLEPCQEFIDLAEKNPELKGNIFKGALPDDLGELTGEKFDGILCSAVLMHIPEKELFKSIYTIRGLIKGKGKLVISVPSKRDDVENNRDQIGRLMVMRDPRDYQLLLASTRFRLEKYFVTEDILDRGGIMWMTMVFHYCSWL